jgi:hypothetical protein
MQYGTMLTRLYEECNELKDDIDEECSYFDYYENLTVSLTKN